VASNKVMVRVTATGFRDSSDAVFTIYPFVTNLSAKPCMGAVNLTWTAVSGASYYNIYRLDNSTFKWTKIDTIGSSFTKYTDSATNAATMAGNAFNSITQNMNSAIDNFVTTGKFKFGDFARSVIQDLIKIELKAQASKLLSGASNMLGSFLGSIFGFAEGGNPPVNKPSIVGEKGPELFVPKTAGTIIPNGGSVGNAAQGNTYITNNISAIDAKSVAQLFAENRKTLFGSVQMAQKELSYGR
jgi:phage-related minor tail protein